MDGACGTELLKKGSCVSLPSLNLSHPEWVKDVHSQYARSGAQIHLTNTFSDCSHEEVRSGVRLLRETIPDAFILGDMSQATIISYQQKASAFLQEDVNGLMVETIRTPMESLTAARTLKDLSDKPVFISLTPLSDVSAEEEWLCLPEKLLGIGVAGIGVNCGVRYQHLQSLMQKWIQIYGPILWFVKLPFLEKESVSWLKTMKFFLDIGCQWVGGCCGTTPKDIQALNDFLK